MLTKSERLKAYKANPQSQFKVGQRVRFKRLDGVVVEDTVRGCFWQHLHLAPWGEDLIYPAVVLTEHSWTAESNIEAVVEDGFERRSRLIAEGMDIAEQRRGRVK